MTTKHTPQQTIAGHTPGPWKVITNSDRQLTISTVKPLIGRQYITHIAQVNFTPVDNPEANAHLIAAAPDMLKALEEAWCRGYFDEHPDDSEIEVDYKDSVKQLIYKAKGQTSQAPKDNQGEV